MRSFHLMPFQTHIPSPYSQLLDQKQAESHTIKQEELFAHVFAFQIPNSECVLCLETSMRGKGRYFVHKGCFHRNIGGLEVDIQWGRHLLESTQEDTHTSTHDITYSIGSISQCTAEEFLHTNQGTLDDLVEAGILGFSHVGRKQSIKGSISRRQR